MDAAHSSGVWWPMEASVPTSESVAEVPALEEAQHARQRFPPRRARSGRQPRGTATNDSSGLVVGV
jgi:hypothetical protein